MHPLVALAYTTIIKTLEEGRAKGHKDEDWKVEPKANHAFKAQRHSITAQGVDTLPEFFPDKESAIKHAEHALVRSAMYLWHLVNEQKQSGGKGNTGNGSLPCRLSHPLPRETH